MLTRRSRRLALTLALGALGLIGPVRAADPRLDGVRVAPGWRAEVAAAEPLVVNPVAMAFGPDARLYVIEWKAGRGANDRVQALRDRDGDGVFDEVTTYLDHLELPAGLLLWDGWTYLTLGHEVVRLRDGDGDGKPEVREVVASGFPHNDSHHRVSGLAIGPDGWLYITAADGDIHARGSDGSMADNDRSGGVFRCRPDGSRLERFAFGMRNPWGNVCFDDQGRLFHTDNDSESTPEFSGCRLLHVVEGGDYGWRVRAGARCCLPDPERSTWDGGRPGRLGAMGLTGRGAPTGACRPDSAAFPPPLRSLLIEPDVFRKNVRGYRLRSDGSTFALAEEVEILGCDDGRFRPSDAELGPDGAVYVSDWRTDSGGASQLAGDGGWGRVYRLTWAGTDAEPARPTAPPGRFAAIGSAPEPDLFDLIAGEDPAVRSAVALELARRLGRDDPAARRSIGMRVADWVADDRKPIPARVALVLLAGGAGPGGGMPWIDPTRFNDVDLRRVAYQALRPDAATEPPARLVAAILKAKEADPAVAREQALALARLAARHAGGETAVAAKLGAMATTFRGGDPAVRDGILRALEQLGPAGRDQVAQFAAGATVTARLVGRALLAGWRGADAAGDVLALATSSSEVPGADRAHLFLALRENEPDVSPEPVARWLRDQPRADLAPRVEAIRLPAAMGPRSRAAAGPIVAGLLGDDQGPVRLAALALVAAARDGSAWGPVGALARDAAAPEAERVAALIALRAIADRSLAPELAGLARDGSAGPALRAEALRTLAAVDPPAAVAEARTWLGLPDPALRGEAIAVLGRRAETAAELVRALAAGTLPRSDSARVIEAARRHPDPALRAAVVALLRDQVAGPAGSADLVRLEEQVRRNGDPTRGRALFLDAGRANCMACHRIEGAGGSVGPDLTRVWESMSFRKRVESILEPSREIKEGYATHRVETADGRVVSGLPVADDAAGVTLRDAQGREVHIPRAEVERREVEATSLMPEGLVAGLSLDEFADLLAFLGDRQAQESLRGTAGGKPQP